MAGLQSLLEDYRNWTKTQDWKLQKQREEMFDGDYQLAEDIDKWGGGFNPSNIGAGLSGFAGAIKASHGSPHAHTKFDLSKIGTGEGAQAYGHGLYFGQGFDSPVAKEYMKDQRGASASYIANRFLKNWGDKGKALDALDAHIAKLTEEVKPEYIIPYQEARSRIASESTDYGPYLYNVELKWPDAAREAADPLGEHHLLDWDATLENQPETIKSALSKLEAPGTNFSYGDLLEMLQAAPHLRDPKEYAWAHPTGQDVYNALGKARMVGNKAPGQVEASNYLRDIGIPGIRYLDQGSRGAGEGTRNYVMFDDRFPNIVSRNGVSLADLLRK